MGVPEPARLLWWVLAWGAVPWLGAVSTFSTFLARGVGLGGLNCSGTQMSPSRIHDPCLQIPLTQHLLLRPRPMATATSPRDLKSPVTPMQPLIPVQLFTPMQPVTLMPLRPPEIDYLLLAIISFFCILLAIPALVFSLKTREANFLGNQRKARINSRLILGFSIASILVGCIVIICSIVIKSLKQKI
uniref:Uncharacterized protein n=3 Tax=Cercopithecinae TaxID=9528 RepID=A0A5F7ZJ48_MACMU